MSTLTRNAILTAAIAAATGGSEDAGAAAVNVALKSVVGYSAGTSSTTTAAGDISASTATWSYDYQTHRLSQTSGQFNVRFNITPAATLFRHNITGLAIGSGAAAAASTYGCVEGNFGGSVGASLCGNYNFGANFLNQSSTSWGPGTAVARTLGGDDMSLGASQSIADYDNFVEISWVGTTLRLSNATSPAPGSFTQEWTLQVLASPPPPPPPGFEVIIDDDLGIAYGINNIEILGVRYDVSFGNGYNGLGGPFAGDREAAIAAAEAVNGALAAAGVENLSNEYSYLHGAGYYQVVYSETEAIQGCWAPWCSSIPQLVWARYDDVDPVPGMYAYFSLHAVPVPAAVWLFGGALLSLGALKRRQSAAKN
jgi:hypothetical protein